MGDGGGGGGVDAADAESDGGDGIALGFIITVVMTLTDLGVMDVVLSVLVTMMMEVKADPSFFSGTLQNLSSPRRPSHPLAPKAVPPAGFPGAPGAAGPPRPWSGLQPVCGNPSCQLQKRFHVTGLIHANSSHKRLLIN